MATQYKLDTKAEAIALQNRLERLGYKVFQPYFQPKILIQNGQRTELKWGTWNIITPH